MSVFSKKKEKEKEKPARKEPEGKKPKVRPMGEVGTKTTWKDENRKLIQLMQEGRLEEAMEQAHRLLDFVDVRYPKEDHPEKATTYNNMGMVLMMKRMFDLADEAFREALDMRRRIFGAGHKDVAVVYLNLAQLYKLRADEVLSDSQVDVSPPA